MSKLEELKNLVQTTVTPDDVVKAILSQVKIERITKDPERIHGAIYALKQKYNEVFKDFDFDKSGLSPFSDLLDRILFRLETTRVLGTLNPAYLQYELPEERSFLKSSLNKFPQPEKERMISISNEFEELVAM